MSKRKTIDAFFKKKAVSNSEIRTLVAVETNVNTSMPNEHPSKCPKLQSEKIDRDPGYKSRFVGHYESCAQDIKAVFFFL